MKTIKCLASLALLLTLLTGAGAQSNFGEFKWGLKGGVNFAGISNLKNLDDKDGKLGLVAGAFFKIPLKHFVSIRPELLFNMKGATYEEMILPKPGKSKFSLNYVEIPLSLDFDLPYFLDVHAGVQGAFLIGKNFEQAGQDLPTVDDFYNSTEFGFHVGAGIDLGNVGLHVRFQQSLSSFVKSQTDFEPRNWGISLTAAYMFAN